MAIFKCKMCGGTIEFTEGATVGVCDSCGTKQTLPRLDDEKKANLYDRANHFRRNNEFDKAMGIYEQILNEDNTDAEAYWSLVLCRYGIEYVDDPATHTKVPTVNRTQFTSIFDDEDYKSAIKNADASQKSIYEEEAKAINEIQKGILAISQKEEPFDVFICYKETDNNGRRTPDSVLANDLYHQLTQEGFKVFFSRITLEDKLGTAYEPYIFAALNSSKVMVVLGTKPEFFNAVWVKNEWSRYLALIKNGANKVLVPAYKDMDPYDLPEEFSHLQAQDMGKLGFMQDLIRGIKKITKADEPKETAKKEAAKVTGEVSANLQALLERGFMALEDGEWQKADDFFEQTLNFDAKLAEAYLGKLMAELQAKRREDLKDCKEPFDNSNNYQKIVRFGDGKLKGELEEYLGSIKDRNENIRMTTIYNNGVSRMNSANTEDGYKNAANTFAEIRGFKDAEALEKECLEKAEACRKDAILAAAKAKMNDFGFIGNRIAAHENAIAMFSTISGWKDADEQINICKQRIEEIKAKQEADRLEAEEKRIAAEKRKKRIKKTIAIVTPVICAVIAFVIVLNTVIIPKQKLNKAMGLLDSGDYEAAYALLEEVGKTDAIAQSKYDRAMKLLDEGDYRSARNLLFGAKNYDGKEEMLRNICSVADRETISAGDMYTVGLKSDGTVVAVGSNYYGQCDVSDWSDIVAISAGWAHTVGLKSDGTVVATSFIRAKEYYCGQCNVSAWSDIVAISAGSVHTVGLKSDGTVVATGDNEYGQCNVSDWRDIVAISAGLYHTVGLKSDGTVVAVGDNCYGQCGVSDWRDIVAISAGHGYTVGLKSDGSVVAVGDNYYGQCDVSEWKDIVAISTGDSYTVGLKSDGSVVAVGDNVAGRCDVSDWRDIVAISAGIYHTAGLKSDGTVVAERSSNDYGQCNVSGWSNIALPPTNEQIGEYIKNMKK